MAAWLGPAIVAGGSILGGLFGSSGASDAAETQADSSREAALIQQESAREALELQRQMYADQLRIYQDQQRMQAPYYGAGTNALAQLSSLYGTYQPEHFAPYQPGAAANVALPAPAMTPTATAPAGGLGGLASSVPQAQSGGFVYDELSPYNDEESGMFLGGQRVVEGLMNAHRHATAPQQVQQVQQTGQQVQPVMQQPQATAPQFTPTGMAGFYAGPEAELAQNSLGVAMDRGIQSLDRSAAASGGILSGAHAKAMSDYAHGTNHQYMQGAYGDYANRLASLAGIGQTAGSASGNIGAQQANAAGNYGANAGNLLQGIGTASAGGLTDAAAAMAAGQMGSSNAWGNALNGLTRAAGAGAFDGLGSIFSGSSDQTPAALGTIPGSQQSSMLNNQWGLF